MPRSPAARCVVALPLLWSACVGAQRARLDAHGVAIGTPAMAASAHSRDARVAEAASTPAEGAAVRADHALEVRLRRELQEKRKAGGVAALEMLEPGGSVESRLRFALSRMLLGRSTEAATALHALTVDAPACALAWFLLGQVRGEEGDATVGAGLLRRARALEREQGIAPHPSLDFALGRLLLRTEEHEEGLRLLRAELAAGAHRVAAAELLAEVQADVGEFEAALAALDAVLDDVPDEPSLVLAKAEILADQLRHDEALALLAQQGRRVAPALLLYRRAVLQRHAQDFDAAAAAMSDLLANHADDPMVKGSLSMLNTTRAELETERSARRRTRLTLRELLGRVRYARQPIERADALRLLCSDSAPAAIVPAAIRWGLQDAHDAVRIAAIQAGLPRCDNAPDLLATVLRDPSASVRSAAAVAAVRQPLRSVFGPLVDAIERESDPDAFRTMHRALVALTGRELGLPFDGERTAATRERVASEWRAELQRAGKEQPRT